MEWWGKTDCPKLTMLGVEDWFTQEGHETECTVWSPCPLLADVMLEELCQVRLKRPYLLQLVLIPRLMTSKWRKQLRKAADLLVSFDLSTDNLWGKTQHEPLIFAACLPLSIDYPWNHRRRGEVVRLESLLPSLWETDRRAVGSHLCQLCKEAWESRGLPRSLVPGVL